MAAMPEWRTMHWRQMDGPTKDAYNDEFLTRPPMPITRFPLRAGHTWNGGHPLGRGGQGCVCLWLQVSPTHQIVERIVVKENQLGDTVYRDPRIYERPAPGRPLEPREYFTQRVSRVFTPIADVPEDRDHVVEPLSAQRVPERASHRLYSEFCDHGNLEQLVLRHLGHDLDYQPVEIGRNTTRSGKKFESVKPIPEAFLWYLFESLTIALCYMERAQGLGPGFPGGDQIVHQDIKHENILLAAPSTTEFRHYPFAKIGDFGSARVTSNNQPTTINPFVFRTRDAHTKGFEPPEIYTGYRDGGPGVGPLAPGQAPPRYLTQDAFEYLGIYQHPTRLLSRTNVWQVARVILALMRLELSQTTQLREIRYYAIPWTTEWPRQSERPVQPDSWMPDASHGLADDYSPELQQLVHECLRADLRDRPFPRRVQRICTRHIRRHYEHVRTRSARRTYRDFDPDALRLKLRHVDRKFAVGKMAP